MVATGRILTRSFEFETRQHKILVFEVREGIPRDLLLIGGGLVAAWFALMTLLFGLPNGQTFVLYATLPTLLVYFGFKADPKRERRKRITTWILAARYVLSAHRAAVRGVRVRGRADNLTLRERIGAHRARALVSKRAEQEVWRLAAHTTAARPFPSGEAVSLAQDVTLIPFDDMRKIARRRRA